MIRNRVRGDVRRLTVAERGRERRQRVAPPAVGVLAGEAGNGCREQQQARREDRRNHARHVQLERQVRGLAGVHAAADLALGVVHRDAALRTLDEHAERGDGEHHHDERDGNQAGHLAGVDLADGLADGARNAGHDTAQDDHGNAVAHAALGDLLTQPHEEHGARGHRDRGDEQELPARSEHHALRLQTVGGDERLEQRETQRAVTRDLGELAPAGLAFLAVLHPLRHHHRHHLHDDRRGDVGHDTHGEDGQALERATREHVDDAEDGLGIVPEEAGHALRVDARHGDVRADAIDDRARRSGTAGACVRRRNAPRRRVLMPGSVSCLPRLTCFLGPTSSPICRAPASRPGPRPCRRPSRWPRAHPWWRRCP